MSAPITLEAALSRMGREFDALAERRPGGPADDFTPPDIDALAQDIAADPRRCLAYLDEAPTSRPGDYTAEAWAALLASPGDGQALAACVEADRLLGDSEDPHLLLAQADVILIRLARGDSGGPLSHGVRAVCLDRIASLTREAAAMEHG